MKNKSRNKKQNKIQRKRNVSI